MEQLLIVKEITMPCEKASSAIISLTVHRCQVAYFNVVRLKVIRRKSE